MYKNFIQKVIAGEELFTCIDDYVDKWNETSGGEELHEFLGLTWDEYTLWAERPEALKFIVNAKIQNKNFFDNPEELMLAARSSGKQEILNYLLKTGRIKK